MKQVKASVMNLKEFEDFLNEISDGRVTTIDECGSWDYGVTEDITEEEIVQMISESLGVSVINVIVDTTKDNVAIIY